jgi:hypothetical protein
MAKAAENRTGYKPIAPDSAEQRPPIPAQEQPAPEDVLRELAGRLQETVPGWGHIRAQVAEAARKFRDPTQVRAVLVRCLFRVAELAETDPRYGPHVRWCRELGVAAVLLPDLHNTRRSQAAWAVLMNCLQHLDPRDQTPEQRLAARAALIAFALAVSLSTDDLQHCDRWLEEAALQSFLIVSDASAATHADEDFSRMRAAFLRDLEAAAGDLSGTRALSPWEDDPLGKLWPEGMPSGLKAPDLVQLRRWAGELTRSAERMNLPDMASREPTQKPVAESGKDPLAEALEAFSDLTPPRLPTTRIDVSPENAIEILEALTAYMEEAGEAMAGVIRVLLRQLQGKSFADLGMTKEFTAKLQALLDLSGHAVECPKCGETGRLEAVPHHSVTSGAIRVRHGGTTNHSGKTVVVAFDLRKLD